jgi:NADPH:quinone reductase-like Zn-dependent oxidoreductase
MDRINTMAEVLVQRGCEQIFSQAAPGAELTSRISQRGRRFSTSGQHALARRPAAELPADIGEITRLAKLGVLHPAIDRSFASKR